MWREAIETLLEFAILVLAVLMMVLLLGGMLGYFA